MIQWFLNLFRTCEHDWKDLGYDYIFMKKGKFFTKRFECTKCGKIKTEGM